MKVKREAYRWLNAAAAEVNLVWNWANETTAKAARPFAGKPKRLSEFDLDKLSAGASEYFERIGSDTIQCVNRTLLRQKLSDLRARAAARGEVAAGLLCAGRGGGLVAVPAGEGEGRDHRRAEGGGGH